MSTHEIEIEYGERYTDFVIGMYVDTSFADDIDELGLNLCDCDDVRFQEEIGYCRLVTETIKNGKMIAVVELMGKNEELQEELVENFLDCWENFVHHNERGLKSRV